MLVGSTNKIINDIYLKLLSNDYINKFLYYNDVSDVDIDELPKLDNPIGDLKLKIFKNRRLERLQREADIGMTVSVYGKSKWDFEGTNFDKNINNLIEVGICCHEECDDTINGSRTYALIDLIINELKNTTMGSVGKIHFENMYRVKDLPIQYSGYLIFFSVFNLKEEI